MRIEGDIRRIVSQGVVYTELSSPHALRNPLSSDSLKLWLMDNILSRQRREKISSMVDWLIKLCVLLSSLLLTKVLNHPSGKNLRIARTTFDKLQEVNRAGRSQPRGGEKSTNFWKGDNSEVSTEISSLSVNTLSCKCLSLQCQRRSLIRRLTSLAPAK